MKTSKNLVRVFLLLFVGVLFLSLYAQKNESITSNESEQNEKAKINWLTIEEAEAKWKENPKRLLVDVYTDWCSWCKVMDKTTFSNAELAAYVNEHYYAVKLNAESHREVVFKGADITEQQLAMSFHVAAYPTVVLMDKKLETVNPIEGYMKAKRLKNILVKYNQ